MEFIVWFYDFNEAWSNLLGKITYIIFKIHYGFLCFPQVIENFQPNLIFSAHSHKSSYLRHIARSEKRMVHIIHDFLLPGMSHISSSDPDNHLPEHLYKESSIKLNLKTTERDLHEIQVPTCSYRMGVPNMGYGVMQLCKLS